MPVPLDQGTWLLRDLAVQYARDFLLTPYEWADADHTGMDCSGFVSEILKGVGIKPHNYRGTSRSMADEFTEVWNPTMEDVPIKSVLQRGCVVCYGRGTVTHVMLAISPSHVIGSTGGGSDTVDEETADKRDAFVKMRPYDYRTDVLRVVDPFLIGEESDG